jgi:hypothetical protein
VPTCKISYAVLSEKSVAMSCTIPKAIFAGVPKPGKPEYYLAKTYKVNLEKIPAANCIRSTWEWALHLDRLEPW